MKLSELIQKAQQMLADNGDLEVYYASDYDWTLPIECLSADEDTGWDNAPGTLTAYLS